MRGKEKLPTDIMFFSGLFSERHFQLCSSACLSSTEMEKAWAPFKDHFYG